MEELFGEEFVLDGLKFTVIVEEVSSKRTKTVSSELLDRSRSEQVELAVNDATQSDMAKLVSSLTDHSRYDIEFNLEPDDHPNRHEVENEL